MTAESQRQVLRTGTVMLLERLRRADWFGGVGVHDSDEVQVASSWAEALDLCASQDWEDVCLEAANLFGERIQAKSRAEYRRWNDVVRAVKPSIHALVRLKTNAVVAQHGLPKVFIDTVRWDILHAFVESEYRDVALPGFFTEQAGWYLKGHFPCGWQGEFPNGRRIVL